MDDGLSIDYSIRHLWRMKFNKVSRVGFSSFMIPPILCWSPHPTAMMPDNGSIIAIIILTFGAWMCLRVSSTKLWETGLM